jgi:DNA-binding response OmpR family regulator
MAAYILLIDDDSIHLEIYRDRLFSQGYEIACAESGLTGILSIQQRLPDLVILDISMPGMSGLEVCDQIRASPRSRDVPVLMLTALAVTHLESEGLRIGADDYLLKSSDRGVFLERVKRLLTRNQRNTQANRVVVSIHLSDSLSFEVSGGVRDRGEGQAVSLDRTRFNREMAFMGGIIYDYYDRWLEAWRRRDDLDERYYQELHQDWRLQASGKGRDLYRNIFEQNARLMEAWGKAQQAVGDLGEHLVLRFGGPRSNLALPFELLHAGTRPLAVYHPVSRQVSNGGTNHCSCQATLRSLRGQTLRALLWAGDDVALPEVQAVADKLQLALAVVGVRLAVDPGDLTQPITSTEARNWLQHNKPYHLVHYAGHAVFDRKRPENSHLGLPDNDSRPGRIRAADLADLLAGSQVQFLYLSCCSGAEIGDDRVLAENAYLGLMDAAIQAGVPAVLGYRWPVVGRSAKIFATHFYEGLAKYPSSLEHAVWWARKQIFETSPEGGWDETWFSPMLVVQNPDYPGDSHA